MDDLYVGIGDFYPYMFYARISFDTNPGYYKQLYDIISKDKKDPLIFIFELHCEFPGDDIIAKKYDLLYLMRDQELVTPPNDAIEQTIKVLLTQECWTEHIIFEGNNIYSSNNDKILNLTLPMIRSLKTPDNIRIIKV